MRPDPTWRWSEYPEGIETLVTRIRLAFPLSPAIGKSPGSLVVRFDRWALCGGRRRTMSGPEGSSIKMCVPGAVGHLVGVCHRGPGLLLLLFRHGGAGRF